MYKFRLQLGDWSSDGHGQTEDIVFETNKDIKELREHYFQNRDKYGDILEEFNSEYEEGQMEQDQADRFTEIGISIGLDALEALAENGYHYVTTDDFADWFVQFMKLDSPDLVLERIPEEKLPTFHFYGFDDKQRHIGFFAYGLFD